MSRFPWDNAPTALKYALPDEDPSRIMMPWDNAPTAVKYAEPVPPPEPPPVQPAHPGFADSKGWELPTERSFVERAATGYADTVLSPIQSVSDYAMPDPIEGDRPGDRGKRFAEKLPFTGSFEAGTKELYAYKAMEKIDAANKAKQFEADIIKARVEHQIARQKAEFEAKVAELKAVPRYSQAEVDRANEEGKALLEATNAKIKSLAAGHDAEVKKLNAIEPEMKDHERDALRRFTNEAKDKKQWGLLDKIRSTVSDMPGFMVELGLTGGAFSAGRALTKKGVEKALGREVGSRLGKMAVGTAAAGAGLAAITAANPQLVFENTARTRVSRKLDGKESSWAASLPAGIADSAVELGSEMAGVQIGRLLGAIGRHVPVLGKRMAEKAAAAAAEGATEATKRGFAASVSRALAQGGFHGIPEEYIEERLGDVTRGLLATGGEAVGTDAFSTMDFGATGQLAEGAVGAFSGDEKQRAAGMEGVEQSIVEAASFGVPSAIRLGAGGLDEIGRYRDNREADSVPKFIDNPSRKNWNKLSPIAKAAVKTAYEEGGHTFDKETPRSEEFRRNAAEVLKGIPGQDQDVPPPPLVEEQGQQGDGSTGITSPLEETPVEATYPPPDVTLVAPPVFPGAPPVVDESTTPDVSPPTDLWQDEIEAGSTPALPPLVSEQSDWRSKLQGWFPEASDQQIDEAIKSRDEAIDGGVPPEEMNNKDGWVYGGKDQPLQPASVDRVRSERKALEEIIKATENSDTQEPQADPVVEQGQQPVNENVSDEEYKSAAQAILDQIDRRGLVGEVGHDGAWNVTARIGGIHFPLNLTPEEKRRYKGDVIDEKFAKEEGNRDEASRILRNRHTWMSEPVSREMNAILGNTTQEPQADPVVEQDQDVKPPVAATSEEEDEDDDFEGGLKEFVAEATTPTVESQPEETEEDDDDFEGGLKEFVAEETATPPTRQAEEEQVSDEVGEDIDNAKLRGDIFTDITEGKPVNADLAWKANIHPEGWVRDGDVLRPPTQEEEDDNNTFVIPMPWQQKLYKTYIEKGLHTKDVIRGKSTHLVVDKDDIEDFSQAASLHLLEQLHKYKDEGKSFNAWAEEVVANFGLKYVEKLNKLKKTESPQGEDMWDFVPQENVDRGDVVPLHEDIDPEIHARLPQVTDKIADELRGGRNYASISDARREAGEILGLTLKEIESKEHDIKTSQTRSFIVEGKNVTVSVKKDIDEYVEQAVVRVAREIVEKGDSLETTFKNLVDLYKRQPNLKVSESDDASAQAYSTPVPLAYVASRLAGIGPNTTVYESSAGNGAMLIDVQPENATTNELRDYRAEALRRTGFNPTEEDATSFDPGQQFDAVIINPPFGRVSKGQRSHRTWDAGLSKETDQIDHAITLQSLKSMKPDGRAVVLIGSPKTGTKTNPKDPHGKEIPKKRGTAYSSNALTKEFFEKVYADYNVVGQFVVKGSLYKRQGAGWDIEVLVIDGTKAGKPDVQSRALPYADVPLVHSSWEQVALRLEDAPKIDTAKPQTSSGNPGKKKPGKKSSLRELMRRKKGGNKGSSSTDVLGMPVSKERFDPEIGKATLEAIQEAVEDGASNYQEVVESLTDEFADDVDLLSQLKPYVNGMWKVLTTEDVYSGKYGHLGKKGDFKNVVANRLKARDGMGSTEQQGERDSDTDTAEREDDNVGDVPRTDEGSSADDAGEPRQPEPGSVPGRDEGTAGSGSVRTDDDTSEPRGDAGVQGDNAGVGGREPGSVPDEGDERRVERPERKAGSDDVAGSDEELEEPEKRTGGDKPSEFQVPYESRGRGSFGIGTLAPRQLAEAMHSAMDAIVEEFVKGKFKNLAAWVTDETGVDVKNYLSDEQVDGVAMFIANHKRGSAGILGDQTGVGKGRPMAVMMEYAKKQGLVPIFVTKDSKLFGDMYRDLTGIKANTVEKPFNALVMNAMSGDNAFNLGENDPTQMKKDGSGIDPEGRKLSQSADVAKRRVEEAIENVLAGKGLKSTARKGGTKTETHDAIFTTYSQFDPDTVKDDPDKAQQEFWRHPAIAKIAHKAFFVMDESHIAGGSEVSSRFGNQSDDEGSENAPRWSRASWFRDVLLNAGGAAFASATFAKNPHVLTLYHLTDMPLAMEGDIDKLVAAIKRGGIPFQQKVSHMLAESGQYLRRERSFEGVEMKPKVLPVKVETVDKLANVFDKVNDFNVSLGPIIDRFEDEIVAQGQQIMGDPSIGERGLDSTTFSSTLWNAVDQMLFALKADLAADEAIASLKAGESPFIATDGTMESLLNTWRKNNPDVQVGDRVDLSFRDILKQYLKRARTVIVKNSNTRGDNFHYVLTDEQLASEEGVLEAFQAIEQFIKDVPLDVPASPLDWIRYRIEKAGYSVGEITGRQTVLEYQDVGGGKVGAVLAKRKDGEGGTAGKTATIKGFNDGTIDVLIGNRTASTGLSAHASQDFVNQKKRHMIIAQPSKNIDDFKQMLGRVHRTGQVVVPRYTLLLSSAPAEIRLASILLKKIASMNANTTGDRDSNESFNAPDIMNIVGDEIVAKFMARQENKELLRSVRLNGRLSTRDGVRKINPKGFASTMTGRLAMKPSKLQAAWWDEISDIYARHIEELDRMGMNPLVAPTLPLQAKILMSMPIFNGDDTGRPFAQSAILEHIQARRLGKSMSRKEIVNELSHYPDSWSREFIDELTQPAMDHIRKEVDKIPATDPEKRLQKNDQLNQQWESIQFAAIGYKPGTLVTVTVGDGVEGGETMDFDGIVIRVKKTNEKASVLAPSAYEIKVAINDPARTVDIPVSQLDRISLNDSAETLEERLDRFETASSAEGTTETRWMGTGNVAAAFSQLSGANGRNVFFTDEDGKIRSGVLMPRSFRADKWAEQRPVVFEKWEDGKRFMTETGTVLVTPDGGMTVDIDESGAMHLNAQGSKAKGSKYWLDKNIISAAGGNQFTDQGNRKRMTVKPKFVDAVLEAVYKNHILQATLDRDAARGILGITKTGASTDQGDSESDAATGDKNDILGMPVYRKAVKDGQEAERIYGHPKPKVSAATKGLLGMTDLEMAVSEEFETDDTLLVEMMQEDWYDKLPWYSKRRTSIRAMKRALVAMTKKLGHEVPLRTGLLHGNDSLGQFMVHSRVARIGSATDINAAIHEMAHAIEVIAYNYPDGGPWKKPLVDPKMSAELLRLGKALYTKSAPKKGGYKREGFAEFFRLWAMDSAKAQKEAPHFFEWWEKDFFGKEFKKAAGSIRRIQKLGHIWAKQGTKQRNLSNVVDPQAWAIRGRKTVETVMNKSTWTSAIIDELASLQALDKEAERLSGNKLRPSKTTGDMAEFLRMSQHSRVQDMVEHGTKDIRGRLRGSQPLANMKNHVRPHEMRDFVLYLFAKRAEAVWTGIAPSEANNFEGVPSRNPGMSQEDVQYLLDVEFKDQAPRFELAAKIAWHFNNDILEYVAEASPTMAHVVKTIRDHDPGAYIPLQRYFNEIDVAYQSAKAQDANMAKVTGRLRGSMREIKEPLQQMMVQATRLVQMAHERRILENAIAFADLDKHKNMGRWIEKLDKGQVGKEVEAIRSADHLLHRLQDLYDGKEVDFTFQAIDRNTGKELEPSEMQKDMVTFFTTMRRPNSPDYMVPVRNMSGDIDWYVVRKELHDALDSLSGGLATAPYAPLQFVLKWFGQVPNRVFKAGTVGLRASFGMVTNPLRDVSTLMQNTSTSGMGVQLFGQWVRAMGESAIETASRTGGSKTQWRSDATKMFESLGLSNAQMLGEDIAHTRRLERGLFRDTGALEIAKQTGTTFLKVFTPWKWNEIPSDVGDVFNALYEGYRDVVQTPEGAPRKAEMRQVAKELGVKLSDELSLDDTITVGLAGRRATVDFAAAGKAMRAWNQVVPFVNVTVQGPRTWIRAFKKNPLWWGLHQASQLGLMLGYWSLVKDEEWYRNLTSRERYLNWFIQVGDDLIQIPRAHESGVAFAGLAEGFLNAAYEEDPDAINEWWDTASEVTWKGLFSAPIIPNIVLALARNKDPFYETPIRQKHLPLKDQHNEYTTEVAKWLASKMEWLNTDSELAQAAFKSPQGIDFVLRNTFGPVFTDILNGTQYGRKIREREMEASDFPVFGRAWKRMGTTGVRPKPVVKMYERRDKIKKENKSTSSPPTVIQIRREAELEDVAFSVSLLMKERVLQFTTATRKELTEKMIELSKDVLERTDPRKTLVLSKKNLATVLSQAIVDAQTPKSRKTKADALKVLSILKPDKEKARRALQIKLLSDKLEDHPEWKKGYDVTADNDRDAMEQLLDQGWKPNRVRLRTIVRKRGQRPYNVFTSWTSYQERMRDLDALLKTQ